MWSINERNSEVISLVYQGNQEKLKGRYDSAIKYYTRAIEIDNNDFEVYYARGKAYFIVGKYELAINDYTKSILLYINEMKDTENTELILNSVIQCALHCGHTIVTKGAYEINALTIIEFTKEYRKTIDSFYNEKTTSIEHVKKEYENYQIRCLNEGLKHFDKNEDSNLTHFVKLAKDTLEKIKAS